MTLTLKGGAGSSLILSKHPSVCLTATFKNQKLVKTALSKDTCFRLKLLDGQSEALVQWLKSYAQKHPLPLFDLDLSDISPFYRKALKKLSQLPFSETISYKQLAKRAGRPKAARAAGSACNQNPFPLLIPCHRVIASDGSLGGFACGLEIKEIINNFESI